MTMHSVVLFKASNDRNGNPCRVYAALDQYGQLVGAWDDGYIGHHAVPVSLRQAAHQCYAVPVSQATYRAILRQGQQAEVFSPGRFD
jgi:hypothetical protein